MIGVKDERPVGRCLTCALVRTCGVPPDYEALYKEGDRYHGERPGHICYRDRFDHDGEVADLRWPRLMAHMRLLDVGCANGAFVRYAAAQGMEAEGLEPNPRMAAWASERCGRPVHGSWATVKGPFDIVTYHDVVEHILDPFEELRCVRALIRVGGMLVVDTPDADDPRFARLGLAWHHMKPVEHVWFFTERHLRWLVTRAGYVVDQVDRPIPGKIVLYGRNSID
jgi:2-polyprenyl-3-methyl-5-hydroxy-6-metoxy-1,4-benzoquinol methylase